MAENTVDYTLSREAVPLLERALSGIPGDGSSKNRRTREMLGEMLDLCIGTLWDPLPTGLVIYSDGSQERILWHEDGQVYWSPDTTGPHAPVARYGRWNLRPYPGPTVTQDQVREGLSTVGITMKED